MSEHATEQGIAGQHGACDAKVRETTPIVTASNTRASRQTIDRCTCVCHSVAVASYTTRDGRTVSLAAKDADR